MQKICCNAIPILFAGDSNLAMFNLAMLNREAGRRRLSPEVSPLLCLAPVHGEAKAGV
jgi:hypothetical protein